MTSFTLFRRLLRGLRECVRVWRGIEPAPVRRNVLYEADSQFAKIRQEALARTNTPDGRAKSSEKLYNTLQFFRATRHVGGRVAECGVFKGQSVYVFCRYQELVTEGFSGEGFCLFDSFEGLSSPSREDRIQDPSSVFINKKYREKGAFHGQLEPVRKALEEFPSITYYPGWIPEIFKDVPDAQYSFVHIDVDLYEPTKGAIEYFFPRLQTGGVIVCDDYGFLHWPGAKQAMDEYCVPRGIPIIPLTTGQCVVLKPCDN